ncbi:MAG: hypothetical protein LBK70_02825 [Clostridiales bacterium]|jgi:hypothetical protein|nr:hypothetical protein [Clostridiales bacterium]
MLNNKRRKYKKIEKALFKRYSVDTESQVRLFSEDFVDDELSYDGFVNLKQRSQFVDDDDLEIIVPSGYQDGVRRRLEFFVARELIAIKKALKHNILNAILFFVSGFVIFAFGLVMSTGGVRIWSEMINIIAWVFVWASVEQIFFESRELQHSRKNLIQLLTASIVAVQAQDIIAVQGDDQSDIDLDLLD